MNRVLRQGPPEPITVEPSPPVCGTCGTPLVREDEPTRIIPDAPEHISPPRRFVCPRGCKRVARTDAP